MRVSKDERVFQMQLWDATTGAYRAIENGDLDQVDATFRRFSGQPRRTVLLDKARDLRPRFRRGSRSCGPDRSADCVIAQYLNWAKRNGLKSVAVYERNIPYQMLADAKCGYRTVDADGFPVGRRVDRVVIHGYEVRA